MDRKGRKRCAQRPGRSKKRQFRGNRHTAEQDDSYTSTSARKMSSGGGNFDVNIDDSLRYFIINFGLFLTLQDLFLCKVCKKNVKFSRRAEKGLGFQLVVQCECDEEQYITSSPQIGKTYEINRRFVFVMRLLGIGFQGISNFCGYMDFGLSLAKTSYYDILTQVSTAARAVAQAVLRKAVKEEQERNEASGNARNHLSVSGDGSWEKRGFTSLIGVVSLIGKFTGKILDVIVKSRYCKSCEIMAAKLDDIEYDAWYENHEAECTMNHCGSSGKMEVDSVLEMFKRSIELYNVYYKNYIGDGDTKTFKCLKDSLPYGEEFEIRKLECVLHVKKRMYKRAKEAKKNLTQLKKSQKTVARDEEKKTATKRTSRGRPKTTTEPAPKIKTAAFTNNIMLHLSSYYQRAIKENKDSIDGMRRAALATFYHKISTDAHPQHEYCPTGESSWCKYNVAEASGTVRDFRHPPALDEDIQPALKKIYEDLTTDDLLSRCLGANTQNNNECFNAMVWNMAPKHVFSGKKIVDLATDCAICTFNEGSKTLLKIMETMGVTIGPQAAATARHNDECRIRTAEDRSCEVSKEHRLDIRANRSLENELYDDVEGVFYEAGMAD